MHDRAFRHRITQRHQTGAAIRRAAFSIDDHPARLIRIILSIDFRSSNDVAFVRDLSQPDMLMMAPFGLPVDLNVLPFLMGIAMYFQTKFTPTTGGGQMAMLNTLMPVMMIFIFYNMPSGLVLYWFVQNVLQAYQSWRIMKTTAPGGAVKA